MVGQADPRDCDSEGCSSPQLSSWEPDAKQSHPELRFWACQQRKLGIRCASSPRITFGRCGGQIRILAPLRRQRTLLGSVGSCQTLEHRRPTDVNRWQTAPTCWSSNRVANSASRMTSTVKLVGSSHTSALTSGLALRVEFGLRTVLNEWHSLDRSWPFCHGVVAYLRIHARIGGLGV